MIKRNNVSNNFEACYLRENSAIKAFNQTVEVEKLLNSPYFNQTTTYMADITFHKNKDVLLKHGFDRDDIHSIISVLGLQSINYPFKGKTQKDDVYILMYFISQKFSTFLTFLDRKFRIQENYPELNLNDIFKDSIAYGDYPISINPPSDEEEWALPETSAERKAKLDKMRSELNADVPKFQGKLAEMATSKSVDFYVRKKARVMCRKYGIDYLTWARDQIKSRNLNEIDFVLE